MLFKSFVSLWFFFNVINDIRLYKKMYMWMLEVTGLEFALNYPSKYKRGWWTDKSIPNVCSCYSWVIVFEGLYSLVLCIFEIINNKQFLKSSLSLFVFRLLDLLIPEKGVLKFRNMFDCFSNTVYLIYYELLIIRYIKFY